MRRRVMMVLASAALAGSLLATDAQARGGGGHGGFGHMGGFGGAHVGAHVGGFGVARMSGFGRARIGGFGRARIGGYMAGIHRGYFGYGTGIHRGHLAVLAAPAFGQTARSNGYADGYAPAPALDAVPNPPVGGPLSEAVTGPGLNIVPCSTVAQETGGTTTCVGLQ
jgi:hypothetical protein